MVDYIQPNDPRYFTDQERTGPRTGRNLAEHGSQLKTERKIVGGRSSQSTRRQVAPSFLAQGLHVEWYLIRTLSSETPLTHHRWRLSDPSRAAAAIFGAMNIDHLPPQQLSSDSTLSGWTLYPEPVFDYVGGSHVAHHHVNDEQHDHQDQVCP